jgi:hypothetical protein
VYCVGARVAEVSEAGSCPEVLHITDRVYALDDLEQSGIASGGTAQRSTCRLLTCLQHHAHTSGLLVAVDALHPWVRYVPRY